MAGAMEECDWNGQRYSASTTLAPLAIAASTLPTIPDVTFERGFAARM